MKIKDYAKDLRGYQEYPQEVVSIFVHFEIAVRNHVNNRGKLTDKTLDKHIDKARRQAFDAVDELVNRHYDYLKINQHYQGEDRGGADFTED